MDKAEFIRLAPYYYALAIVSYMQRHMLTAPVSEIVEYFADDSDGPEDKYYIIVDGKLMNLAIHHLVEDGLITAELDPFGPTLITPSDHFDTVWGAVARQSDIYSRYERSGTTKYSWISSALRNLAMEERRLEITEDDYDASNQEWDPIQIDRDTPEVQQAIVAVDKAIEALQGDNGYSASKPEERDYVIDSLNTFNRRLKEGATITWVYTREFALQPIGRALKSLGRSATGLLVEAAKAKIKELLMKYGWPGNWF